MAAEWFQWCVYFYGICLPNQRLTIPEFNDAITYNVDPVC